jgi:ribonuclease HI
LVSCRANQEYIWNTIKFETWEDCKEQVIWFKNAVYKSFSTKDAALIAFKNAPEDFIWKENLIQVLSSKERAKYGEPILESICVDAAWNTATGMVEYKGIDFKTKKELFHVWPLEDGTNNVVEFLAIVHALGYCQKKWLDTPIYSDSRNAIKWVKEKHVNTKLEKTQRNKKLFDYIVRAIVWLETNAYTNKILKWETKAWGENPADFGRK